MVTIEYLCSKHTPLCIFSNIGYNKTCSSYSKDGDGLADIPYLCSFILPLIVFILLMRYFKFIMKSNNDEFLINKDHVSYYRVYEISLLVQIFLSISYTTPFFNIQSTFAKIIIMLRYIVLDFSQTLHMFIGLLDSLILQHISLASFIIYFSSIIVGLLTFLCSVKRTTACSVHIFSIGIPFGGGLFYLFLMLPIVIFRKKLLAIFYLLCMISSFTMMIFFEIFLYNPICKKYNGSFSSGTLCSIFLTLYLFTMELFVRELKSDNLFYVEKIESDGIVDFQESGQRLIAIPDYSYEYSFTESD